MLEATWSPRRRTTFFSVVLYVFWFCRELHYSRQIKLKHGYVIIDWWNIHWGVHLLLIVPAGADFSGYFSMDWASMLKVMYDKTRLCLRPSSILIIQMKRTQISYQVHAQKCMITSIYNDVTMHTPSADWILFMPILDTVLIFCEIWVKHRISHVKGIVHRCDLNVALQVRMSSMNIKFTGPNVIWKLYTKSQGQSGIRPEYVAISLTHTSYEWAMNR